MFILLFLAPRQIIFQCPGPTKQDLLFALDGPFIFYYDTVLKAVTLLSLGFIRMLLRTYSKMMSSSPMLSLVLFATAHANQCALCVTLLYLLMLFYFKSSISPNSRLFIISRLCTLSAPHKPHFRPRRGFCLLYT